MSSRNDTSRYKPDYSLTREDIFGPEIEVARREYVFFDEDGNVVDRDSGRAKQCAITEYDKDGNVIQEVFGYVGKP